MTDAELRHTALTLAVSLGSGHGHHDVLAAAQEFYMFLKPTMPVADAGKGAGGSDDLSGGLGAGPGLEASGGAENVESVDEGLLTDQMVKAGAGEIGRMAVSAPHCRTEVIAINIWRAMEAARLKVPGTAHPSDFIYPAKP